MAGYLELIRPPNVATAVGDVLAGYAVAGLANLPALPWLLFSTVCLYGGGIVLNDVFDLETDRRERPERPLPSGRVPVRAAATLGGSLLAVGVVAASFATRTAAVVALGTAALILLYDGWTKRYALIGPVNMGLCRAGNLALGIAAVPELLRRDWWLTAVPLVYIAAVTAVSRGEVHGGRRGVAGGALISLGLVLTALAWLSLRSSHYAVALLLSAALAARVLPPFWQVWKRADPTTIRRAVKTGVLSLVLIDAVIGAIYGGPLWGAAILVTALVAGALARQFAVT